MKTGIQLISAERKRQITKENWSLHHDDAHTRKQMANAAVSYIEAHAHPDTYSLKMGKPQKPCSEWPWAKFWWKPSIDPIRNLVKAGALIAAEIDRLQRKAANRRAAQNEKDIRP